MGGKTILVIDDDPDFLDYVQIILSANNYRILTAINAEEGLSLVRSERPDLVIVDVMMSYALDGWTVSREMRADPHLQDVPIMMVSAVVSDQDEELFPPDRDVLIDDFVRKPLDPSELLRCIRELTGQCAPE
ncbi:MAG: two-component system response regulator [Anaerolineales bacterium]